MTLRANDKTWIERCIKEPVSFTYAETIGDKPGKLLRSSTSQSQIPLLSRLSLAGYLSQRWSHTTGSGPREMMLTFTATALGRDEVDYHAPIKVQVHHTTPKTPAQLLAEANERD